MVLVPLLALAFGFEIFYGLGAWPAQVISAHYTAIALLAGLDTIVGGVRAWQSDTFDDLVFVSGFFLNALLAVGLVVVGEQLGLETGVGDGRISVMMIGAVVVFSGRILNNLAAIRHTFVEQWRAWSGRRAAAAQTSTLS